MQVETEVVEPQVTEPADDTLDSIISGAIEKSAEASDTEAPTTESGDRPRDEKGRFAPKDSATEAAPVEGQADKDANAAKPTGTEPVQVEQPLEAPARWTDAEKAQFATWPKDVQKNVLDRYKAMEADYTRKTQEVAETRKTVEPVVQELGKWTNYLQQIGVKPEQAIGQMLTVEYNLRSGTPEQKAQALAYLAELYGVNLPNSNSGEPAQPGDPQSQHTSRELAELRRELQGLKTQTALSERQRAEAEFAALGQTKDANGQPKYPHFERVRQTMIQLVATNQADSWDAAYSKATRLDDELYNQIVEQERQSVLAAQEKQRQEAIEKANKAKPVKTSSAMPKGATQGADLDSIISEAMAKKGM